MTIAQRPMPPGVTIRQLGDPRPCHNRPRNVLERAAMCDDRAEAIQIISAALGLQDDRLAQANLSESYRWRRFDPSSRLSEIAGWIKAECFECMDLVSLPDINTLGD